MGKKLDGSSRAFAVMKSQGVRDPVAIIAMLLQADLMIVQHDHIDESDDLSFEELITAQNAARVEAAEAAQARELRLAASSKQ